MLVLSGVALVLVCVLGGFAAMGGNLGVLWQPFEVLIVVGAAAGAYVIGNPMAVLRRTGTALSAVARGPRHNKESYLELIGALYAIFKVQKTRGPLALERDIDDPDNSPLFEAFPRLLADRTALTFLCDYLRLISLGSSKPQEIEALMEEELATHTAEQDRLVHAFQSVADATPALGIVAAVLGVIKTMGAINEPPEVLGGLIGGALVGTFVGVFLAYGFIGPIAASLRSIYESESKTLHCIRAALLAHLAGYSPAIAAEFARKTLMSDLRPTFEEVETATSRLQITA